MKKAFAIDRSSRTRHQHHRRRRERGMTMVLVAVAMVAIIAMAALSIDVVTLYLAREEAQRSADAAALAAARVLSVSGITGTADTSTDRSSWASICGGPTSVATQTAQTVGAQNAVGSIPPTVTVTYSAGSGINFSSSADCDSLSTAFAVNPMVTVVVNRLSLPTFFSRAWGNRGNSVSATATAEAFNPSNSGNVGNGVTGVITSVRPRCVKPWAVPNHDPLSPGLDAHGFYCDQRDTITGVTTGCNSLVSASTGAITNPGISLNGTSATGVIGERFSLTPDCRFGGGSCRWRTNTPQANYIPNPATVHVATPPNLLYVPAAVTTPVTAIPSCAAASAYEEAIGGCDESTNYECGAPPPGGGNIADLSVNPGAYTATAVQCLIGEGDPTDSNASGQDTLSPFALPAAYPFQILAGTSTPLSGLSGKPISSSNSIVSLPIFDNQTLSNNSGQNAVTFVGFLQVFINKVDQYGSVDVTVLNVAGCSNGGGPNPVVGAGVPGSSPVPVRLITP